LDGSVVPFPVKDVPGRINELGKNPPLITIETTRETQPSGNALRFVMGGGPFAAIQVRPHSYKLRE
jgi:hypothetical protein